MVPEGVLEHVLVEKGEASFYFLELGIAALDSLSKPRVALPVKWGLLPLVFLVQLGAEINGDLFIVLIVLVNIFFNSIEDRCVGEKSRIGLFV